MDMKVKQTAEGLYYNADDVEELVRRFCHVYPSNVLYVLWTTFREARREYYEDQNTINNIDTVDNMGSDND